MITESLLKYIVPGGFISGLIMYVMVVRLFVWKHLWRDSLGIVLLPLVALHLCRYLGIMFSIEGIVSSNLPEQFYFPATVGDLITTTLAWLTLLLIWKSIPGWKLVFLVFNVVGLSDFVYAFAMGYQHIAHPGMLGTTYFIVTFMVPALVLSHMLMFILIVKRWREPLYSEQKI